MWIDGGKRYQFMMGRDFMRHAHYSAVLNFGWRGNVPEGETQWDHHWYISTRCIEDRLKRLQRWRRRETPILDLVYWPCVRWKYRTLIRLRERKCERLGGHIYKPTPEQLPYHIGRCIRCQKSQPW